MENDEVGSLREWAPLTEVLDKIPASFQRGLFPHDLNVTCIDVLPEFMALGTDAGIVFWYNRSNGEIQKLRAELTSPITCVRVVSSVEFMVAAGSRNGYVSVFQIQKEVPPDLNLAAPLTKAKPIERYTIRDLHKTAVTCCEWSKNGMKLFSGDKHGLVVLTEIDYQTHVSKSAEILNESYDIIQLSLNQSYLVVSTIYRSIVCERESNGRWRVSQIGKKDRKVLHDFGAVFRDTSKRDSSIICSRPGLRFWIADPNGNVQQTLLFREAVNVTPKWKIPLLNPGKKPIKLPTNFGLVYMYLKNFILTYDKTILYILNLEKLRVEATTQHFRGIYDVAICGKEIFILEGPRSLIRIAPFPEPPNKTAKIIFNPLMPPPIPSMPSLFGSPIEFEAEDEAIANAEECFELPPIEHIDLDVSITSELDSPTTKQSKLIMEQNRRLELFDSINNMQFDETILHHSEVHKKHRRSSKGSKGSSSTKATKSGIVEIGQDASECGEGSSSNHTKKVNNLEITTKSETMEASFGPLNSKIFELKTPEMEPREIPTPNTQKLISDILNIEPIKLVEIPEEEIKKIEKSENKLKILQYPINYPSSNVGDAEVQTTPRKKLHFINDDDEDDYTEEYKTNECSSRAIGNLCDDMKSVMIQSDCTNNILHPDIINKMTKSLQFVPCQVVPSPTTSKEELPIPDIQPIPGNSKIQELRRSQYERTDSQHSGDSQNSSDWEIVETT